MKKTIYVTTAIPYVNAQPHIGHALELVQADVIARYHRLIGNATRFQTGTDENAFKNVTAAREKGIPTEQLVSENSLAFQNLCHSLQISHDDFIRTTEDRHRLAVHKLWRQLRRGDIYKASYQGLYCVGCEDFVLEKGLVDGCCPDHRKPPIPVEEENYFFRLSHYQSQIEDLIESGRISVIPSKRKNEVLSFIRSGLHDFSVSREAARAGGWGIPVPDDPSQVIYVWADALTNYISGLGFGQGDDWQRFWSEDTKKIHVIGKNVWKFHAVYWPAMLISAGLPTPDEIVVHGFLTIDNQKISKSLGNTVDPLEYVETYGADAVRHYLLRAVSPYEDGDFSQERFTGIYNADLANELGNLLSRLTTLCERAKYGQHECELIPEPPAGYTEALNSYEFDKAIASLWSIVSRLNRDIEREKPWESLKANDRISVRQHLRKWLSDLRCVGYWLEPFLPNASKKILEALGRKSVEVVEPLFPRVR